MASSEKSGAFLAAFSYLAVSSAAMVFFLFGVFGFYRLTGSLSYTGIAAGLARLPDSGGLSASLATACLGAAVAIRVAVMPVYGWLPDAHALAPHAVSAVLSGVLIKTPLFALGRLLVFLPKGTIAMELLGAAGAITALAAVIVALSQKDAKRLLAYHSISQIGYVVAAWGVGTVAGLTAAFLHALFHALFKGGLFLSVGTAMDAAGERDVYKLRGAAAFLRSAGDRAGVTLAVFIFGALSIAALPPFNGFASKNAISALFDYDWRYWVLFIAGIGTVASFLKLSRVFMPEPRQKKEPVQFDPKTPPVFPSPSIGLGKAFRVDLMMKLAMLVLASLCLISGLGWSFIYKQAVFLISASELPLLGDAAVTATPSIYNTASLLKAAITLGSGILVYAALSTKMGKRFASLIRSRPRSFAGLVAAFCLGLGLLALRLI